MIFLKPCLTFSKPKNDKPLMASVKVFIEAANSTYSDSAAATYCKWASQLLVNHVCGGNIVADKECDKLIRYAKKVKPKRQKKSHLYMLEDRALLKKSRIIAVPKYVKRAHPLIFCSFLKYLPTMQVEIANDAECLGYALDALLGLHLTPTTVKFEEGSLVSFIKDAKPLGAGFIDKKGGAKALLSLEKSSVHLTAISGMIKGLMAHHIDNYVVKDGKIYEIDLEECLPPFNKPSKIVIGRMAVLGLPQCKEPFDRALLLLLTHPSIKAAAKSLPTQNKKALADRIDQLQKLSRKELKKKKITATPRDFYFAIFGGKNIYDIAKAKHYPDLIIFNQVISDPYQSTWNFLNPKSLKKYKGKGSSILRQNLQRLD